MRQLRAVAYADEVARVKRLAASVCLSVCPHDNSKANEPKVFKLGIWYME